MTQKPIKELRGGWSGGAVNVRSNRRYACCCVLAGIIVTAIAIAVITLS